MKATAACLFGGALVGAGLANHAQAQDMTAFGQVVLTEFNYSFNYYGYDYSGGGYSGGGYSGGGYSGGGYSGGGYGFSYTANYGDTSVDLIDFTVQQSAQVQIDVLSWGIFETWIDPVLYLFKNDGPPSFDNYIAYNDDSYFGSYRGFNDLNGSISSLDSFLDIFLEAGDYTLAVGTYPGSLDDIINGVGFGGGIYGPLFGDHDAGSYQVDFYGIVPAPGSAALLLAASGFAARRRR